MQNTWKAYRKQFSVILAIALLFSVFMPQSFEVKAVGGDNPSISEQATVQTTVMPLIQEEEAPKADDASTGKTLQTMEIETVPGSVYGQVYDANSKVVGGISFQLYDTNYYSSMGPMPVVLRSYGLSNEVLQSIQSGMSFNAILRSGEIEQKKNAVIKIDNNNLYLLIEFDSVMESNAYGIKVEAVGSNGLRVYESGWGTINFTARELSMKKYFASNVPLFSINISGFAKKDDLVIAPMTVELIDSEGKVYAKNLGYSEFSARGGWWTVPVFQEKRYPVYYASAEMISVEEIQEGDYTIRLKIGEKEISLPDNGKVTFVSDPVIDGVYTSSSYNFTPGTRGFSINISGYNIPSKDNLKAVVKDNKNEIVAVSESSTYSGAEVNTRRITIIEKMKVLQGKEIYPDERYSVELIYNGTGIVKSNLSSNEISSFRRFEIVALYVRNADSGLIEIKAANVDLNKTYKFTLYKRGVYGDMEPISSLDAKPDQNGKFILEFPTELQYSLEYQLRIDYENGSYTTGFYLPYNGNTNIPYPSVFQSQGVISSNDNEVKVSLNTVYMDVTIENLDVKLVDAENEEIIVGVMDKDSAKLSRMDMYNTNTNIFGVIKLLSPLEAEKNYLYKVNGVKCPVPVLATDKELVVGFGIKESIYIGLNGSTYRYIDKNLTELNLYANAINVENDNDIRFELCDLTGKKIAEASVQNSYANTNGSGKVYNALLKLTEKLIPGQYELKLVYRKSAISSNKFEVTQGSYVGQIYTDRFVSSQTDRISVTLNDALNIDVNSIIVSIKDSLGVEIPCSIDENSFINESNGRYVSFDILASEPLKPIRYSLEVKSDNNPYPVKKDIYALSNTVIFGSGSKTENGVLKESYILGVNLTVGRTYKALVYRKLDSSNLMGITGYEYISTVNLARLDRPRELVYSNDELKQLPNGEYSVFVEADGELIGLSSLRVNNSDVEGPEQIKVTLSDGKYYTNKADIIIAIKTDGYTKVAISNTESGLTNSDYTTIQELMKWKLDAGDGEKTVYLQFMDASGKKSSVITAKIILDTQAPGKPSIKTPVIDAGIRKGENFRIEVESDSRNKVYAVFYDSNGNVLNYNETNANFYLGYVGKNQDEKYVFAGSIPTSGDMERLSKIRVFSEDFAGNISEADEVAVKTISYANITGSLLKPSANGNIQVPYRSVQLLEKQGNEYVHFRWSGTNEVGVYRFNDIPDGDYRLFIYGERGYKDFTDDVKVENGSDINKDLVYVDKYEARKNLKISVKDKSGNGVADVWVNISNWTEGLNYYEKTDVSGEKTLTGLPAGFNYIVSINRDGYNEWKEVEIKADTDAGIEFIVPEMATISGKVTKGSEPLQDVQIVAEGSNGRYIWAGVDADGKYLLNVQKEEGVTYKVKLDFVRSKINRVVSLQDYSSVNAGDTDVDFSVYDGIELYGKVVDSNGAAVETRIYATRKGDYSEFFNIVTNSNGEYKFAKVFAPGTYTLYTAWKEGYYGAQQEVTITEDDIISGTRKEVANFVMKKFGVSDAFNSPYNSVKTDVASTQRGKEIAVKVKYHNNSDRNVSEATIKANIPIGTEIVASAGSLQKQVSLIRPGEQGELAFVIKVNDDFEGNRVVVSAVAILDGDESSLGFAEIEILDATINAPQKDADGDFKVYGEVTAESTVEIIDRASNNVLSITKPNGKWYSAIVTGLAEGTYTLVAKVTKGENTYLSDEIIVQVKSDAIQVEDIQITSIEGQNVGINEDLGIPAFSVWVDTSLKGRPIDVKVKLKNTSSSDVVKFSFSGKDEYAVSYENGYWIAKVKDWSGSGTQQLKVMVKNGDEWLTFIVAELTILIDPSGYVYDEYTQQRIQGATATIEILQNNQWVRWEAEKYGQINPQITDVNGNYGWMVPNGVYRVKVEKEGYEAYVTTIDPKYSDAQKNSTIVIPPPRMDVNIGLNNVEQPDVIDTIPTLNGEAALNSKVTVMFNKSIDSTTVNSSSFKVMDDNDNLIEGTFEFTDNDTRVVFNPALPLIDKMLYHVILTSEIKDKTDRAGTQRALDSYGFSFTANSGKVVEYMNIIKVIPENGAVNVDKATTISVVFDKDVDSSTIINQYFKLQTVAGDAVLGNLKLKDDRRIVDFIPDTILGEGVEYRIKLESDIKSIFGEYLEDDKEYSFKIKSASVENPGTDPGTNPEDTQPGESSNVIPVEVVEDSAKQQVKATDGGRIELKNKVSIEIPANVLKADAEVCIEKIKDTGDILPKDSNMKLESDIYDLTSTGESRFSTPVAVTFIFDKAKVVDASKLAVFYFHEGRNQWIYLGGSTDATKGTITVNVNHFTKFAVFAVEGKTNLVDMDSHWSSRYVNRLVGLGIVNGIDQADGKRVFEPEQSVTKEQFAKFISMANNLDISNTDTVYFKDWDKVQDWAKPYVAAAYKAGIIKGSVDSNGDLWFNPSVNITRAEMATMIGRSLNASSSRELKFMDKDEIPSWAVEFVRVAVEKGIISGYEDNTFRPEQDATRGEAAKIIITMLEDIGI